MKLIEKRIPSYVTILVFLIIFGNLTGAIVKGTVSASDPIHDHLALQNTLNMSMVEEHVKYLSDTMYAENNIFPTRATGTQGNILAAQYIYDKFLEYGLENVTYHNFTVVLPVNHGANITVPDGSLIEIYPVLPNLVCPSTTPPEGITGQLVYAGEGCLQDFDGKKVEGNIVLLDWDTAERWINALKLGAKAVIFLPPENLEVIFSPYGTIDWARPFWDGSELNVAYHGESTISKYLLDTPVNFPRFVVREEEKEILLAHLGETVTVKSTVVWEEVTGRNVVGYVQGETPDIIFGVTSYYDSYSEAPDLAPGAQEACGVATLLELAHYYSQHKPKPTLVFIAFGGHHQSLAGAMAEVNDYYYWPTEDPDKAAIAEKTWFLFNLDLSTGSDGSWVSVIRYGWDPGTTYLPSDWANPNLFNHLRNIWDGINVARMNAGLTPHHILFDYGAAAPQAFVRNTATGNAYYDQARPTKALRWDSDPFGRAKPPDPNIRENWGGPYAVTISTPNDPRPLYYSPYDTFSNVDFNNLENQLRFVHALIVGLYEEDPVSLTTGAQAPMAFIKPYGKGWRQSRRMGWNMIKGKVGVWDPTIAWYKPVPNALVYFSGYAPAGVTADSPAPILLDRRFCFTDENGYFEFKGGIQGTVGTVFAFVLNSTSGNIIMGPDTGRYQYANPVNKFFWGDVDHTRLVQDLGWVVVFNCSTVVLPDNVLPLTLSSVVREGTTKPPSISVREFVSHVEVDHWGSHDSFQDPSNLDVVFVPSNVPFEIILRVQMERYPTAILINASKEIPAGVGYTLEPGTQLIFTQPILRYADNLRWMIYDRLSILGRFKPATDVFFSTFNKGVEIVEEAHQLLQAPYYQYSKAYNNAIEAWSILRNLYNSQRLEIEGSSSVAPYLALFLVPFTFLFERLIFKASGMKRILSFLGIFISYTVALSLTHPAFEISSSPITIFIGTSTLILILPVLGIVFGKTSALVGALRVRILGKHEAEVSRVDEVLIAVTTGIENMRRRKLRTALMLSSFIVMISSLVAFTSISSLTLAKMAPHSIGNPAYEGLLIRQVQWAKGPYSLGETLTNYITTKYADVATVAPRAWQYSFYVYYEKQVHSDYEETGYRITYNGKNVTAHALIGLTAQEKNLVVVPAYLKAGGWFEPEDTNALILTDEQAQKLGVDGPALVYLEGVPFRVVGIVDSNLLNPYVAKDLDGEGLTPLELDFPPSENPWNIHLPSDDCFLLTYWAVTNLFGGGTASIALKVDNATLIHTIANEIFSTIPGIQIFSFDGSGLWMICRGLSVTIMGIEFQSVPLLIVSLIILNTLIGNVLERKREISAYSTLGISPLSIAFMFVGETVVYAVVSGATGFIIGMVMLRTLGTWLYVNANFTATSLGFSVGLSMLVAVVSSIYPSFIAARLVTPSLERAWRLPTKPLGDKWEVPLPFFASSEEETNGILAFTYEFMQSHALSGAPVFSSSDTHFDKENNNLRLIIRLFPYEAGVSQESVLQASEQATNRWVFAILIERKTGIREIWEKSNRDFIDEVRKQFLLWRVLKPEERKKYYEMFKVETE